MLKVEWQTHQLLEIEAAVQSTINDILADLPFTVLDSINSQLETLLQSPDSGLPKQLLAFKPSLSPIAGILLSQLSLGSAPPQLSIHNILPASPALLSQLFALKYPTLSQQSTNLTAEIPSLSQTHLSLHSPTPSTTSLQGHPAQSTKLPPSDTASTTLTSARHPNPPLSRFLQHPLHLTVTIPSLPQFITSGFVTAQQAHHIHTLLSYPSLFSSSVTDTSNPTATKPFGTGVSSLSMKVVTKANSTKPFQLQPAIIATPPLSSPSSLSAPTNFTTNPNQDSTTASAPNAPTNHPQPQFRSSNKLLSTLHLRPIDDLAQDKQRYTATITGFGLERTTGFQPSAPQSTQSTQPATNSPQPSPPQPSTKQRSTTALLATLSASTTTPLHTVPSLHPSQSPTLSLSQPQPTNLTTPYLPINLAQSAPIQGTFPQVQAYLDGYSKPLPPSSFSSPLSSSNSSQAHLPLQHHNPAASPSISHSTQSSTTNPQLPASMPSQASNVFNLDTLFVLEVNYAPDQSFSFSANTTFQLQNPIQIMTQGLSASQPHPPTATQPSQSTILQSPALKTSSAADDVLSPLPPGASRVHELQDPVSVPAPAPGDDQQQSIWTSLTKWFQPQTPSTTPTTEPPQSSSSFLFDTQPKQPNRRSSMAGKRWQAKAPFSSIDTSSQSLANTSFSAEPHHSTTLPTPTLFSPQPPSVSVQTPSIQGHPDHPIDHLNQSSPIHDFMPLYSPILKPNASHLHNHTHSHAKPQPQTPTLTSLPHPSTSDHNLTNHNPARMSNSNAAPPISTRDLELDVTSSRPHFLSSPFPFQQRPHQQPQHHGLFSPVLPKPGHAAAFQMSPSPGPGPIPINSPFSQSASSLADSSIVDTESIYSVRSQQSSARPPTKISRRSQEFQQSLTCSPSPFITLPIGIALQRIQLKIRLYVVLVHSTELHAHLITICSQLLFHLRANYQFTDSSTNPAVQHLQAMLDSLVQKGVSPDEPTICIFTEDLVNSSLFQSLCPSTEAPSTHRPTTPSDRFQSHVTAGPPQLADTDLADLAFEHPTSSVSQSTLPQSTPSSLPYPLTDFKLKITFGGNDIAGGSQPHSNSLGVDMFSRMFPTTPGPSAANLSSMDDSSYLNTSTGSVHSDSSSVRSHTQRTKVAKLDAAEQYIAHRVATTINEKLSVPIIIGTRSRDRVAAQTSSAPAQTAQTSSAESDAKARVPEALDDFLSMVKLHVKDVVAGFKTSDISNADGSFVPTRCPLMLGGAEFAAYPDLHPDSVHSFSLDAF